MLLVGAVATVLAWSTPPSVLLSRRRLLASAAAAALPAYALEPDVPVQATELIEPAAARKLLALVAGRRPADWSDAERPQVDALIDEVAALQAPWPRGYLRGKYVARAAAYRPTYIAPLF